VQDGDGGDTAEQTFDKKFGDLVREKREQKQWSQRRLAELLEEAGVRLDPSAVTRIERGTRDVKLREAAAIAAVLGFDLGKSLDGVALSTVQQFRTGAAALAAAAVEARRTLAEALGQWDRIEATVGRETEERLISEGGRDRVEFYTALIRNHPDREKYWAGYFDDVDLEIKQAIVDAVVEGIFVEVPF
jgi:transcriptional regulator with XRE-family HTH domain